MIGYRCKDRDIFSRVVLITRKAFLIYYLIFERCQDLVELVPLKKNQLKQRSLGGYSSEVPPLPIPNREVKLTHADGTAYLGGRVGSRLFKPSLMTWLFFVCKLSLRLALKSRLFAANYIYNPWLIWLKMSI